MKATGYEILFIVKVGLTEEQRNKVSEKVQGFITEKGAVILEYNAMGLKDFPMELKKQKQGYYYQIHFLATPEQVKHLQDELKVNENVFRHLIVSLDSILPKAELAEKLAHVAI
jgi:small subunit ribosomal protein S6